MTHVKPILYELADLTMDDISRRSLQDITYIEDLIHRFYDLCDGQQDIKMVSYVDALIKCMSVVRANLIKLSKIANSNEKIKKYYNLQDLLYEILEKFHIHLRIKYYIEAPLTLSDNILYVTTFDFMNALETRHETQEDITDDIYEGIKRIQKVINKHKMHLDQEQDIYSTFSPQDKKLHDEDVYQITETQKCIDYIVENFLGKSNKDKYYKDFPTRLQVPVAGGRRTRRHRKNKLRNRNKTRR